MIVGLDGSMQDARSSKALTTALSDDSDHVKVHTVPWRGPRFSTGAGNKDETRISMQGGKSSSLATKSFSPWFLPPGPRKFFVPGAWVVGPL